tara:strand:- start:146 stop:1048 length:903 start_codon:yes stop_codon:yes gene_type:complete
MSENDDFIAQLSAAPLAPGEVSESLRPRIDELDLWRNVEELRDEGATVVTDAIPLDWLDELRAVIHEAIEALGSQAVGDGMGHAQGVAEVSTLLGNPVVDKVVSLPKLQAMWEYNVGMGFRAGSMAGTILQQSDPNGDFMGVPLHADHAWLPQPWPEHICVSTVCLPCEGMTEAEGATRFVPGSHLHRRMPSPEEVAEANSVPLVVPKGGFAMWNGSTWHETGVRTVPGVRTLLHASCQRLYTTPIEDYTDLLRDEAYMTAASNEIRGLLGADLMFGTYSSGGVTPDPDKAMKTILMSQQ